VPLLISWDYGNTEVMHGRFTVGKANADIVVADEYLSAPHVVFWPQGEHWLAEDMASTNGTWLNGPERVYGPVKLSKGDKVRIGRTVLTVVPF
jgi:pSer/pThr/pTyr-binding forkhead associated (FHA) protein